MLPASVLMLCRGPALSDSCCMWCRVTESPRCQSACVPWPQAGHISCWPTKLFQDCSTVVNKVCSVRAHQPRAGEG